MLLAISPWVIPDIAVANHYHSGSTSQLHIHTAHWATAGYNITNDEDICSQSYDLPNISSATLDAYTSDWFTGTSVVWDLTGSGAKIDLYKSGYACDDLASQSWIDIEAKAFADPTASGVCTGSNVSCVNFGDARIIDGILEDYWQGYVFFKTSHLTGTPASRRKVTNHEFGHIVGLKDPPPTDCTSTGGVMHHQTYYGCTDGTEAPLSTDKLSVEQNIMPYPHINE